MVIGLPVAVLAFVIFYKIVLVQDRSATLVWTAPTENENNEPLANLAGYQIHCWAAESQYVNTIEIDDPTTTSYVIEELEPGNYNCTISAVNANGSVSAPSNVVAKTVP